MPVIHDVRCIYDGCDYQADSVMLREKDDEGNWRFPECPICGDPTVMRPTKIATPSTRRKEIPKGMNNQFVNETGFAWRDARERKELHLEDRRKGRVGNQDEFPDLAPLTEEERKENNVKEVDETIKVYNVHMPKGKFG